MRSLIPTFIVMLVPIGGCSVLDDLTSRPTFDPYTLHLANGMPVRVHSEYLDRYTCASDTPLVCQCTARAGETCDCHC